MKINGVDRIKVSNVMKIELTETLKTKKRIKEARRPKHYGKTCNVWNSMIQRCTNPKHKAYKDYGGRGITICEEWLNSYEDFYRDMGKKPEGLEIDRIHNDFGYSKDNCRWTTRSINMQNTRRGVLTKLSTEALLSILQRENK